MSSIRRKHSFYDLDESWYRYMAADPETRRKMCESILETEDIVVCIGTVIGVVLLVAALIKGWI